MSAELRTCIDCGETLPIERFGVKRNYRSVVYRRRACKPCTAARARADYAGKPLEEWAKPGRDRIKLEPEYEWARIHRPLIETALRAFGGARA